MTMTRTDRDLLWLMVIVVLFYGMAAFGQIDHPRGTATFDCQISPIEQESQEGYFPCVRGGVDQRHTAISINVDPGSDMATFLRAKAGSTVHIIISSR